MPCRRLELDSSGVSSGAGSEGGESPSPPSGSTRGVGSHHVSRLRVGSTGEQGELGERTRQ